MSEPIDMLIDQLNGSIVETITIIPGTHGRRSETEYQLSRKTAKDLIMEFVDRYNTGKAAA